MSFVGTELKICVSIDPIDGYTMYKNVDGNLVIDIRYELEFYTSNKRKKVTCSYLDCIPNDENSCIALVDTSTIGAGELICVIRAYVPDSNFADGSRTEVDVIKTNIIINKI